MAPVMRMATSAEVTATVLMRAERTPPIVVKAETIMSRMLATITRPAGGTTMAAMALIAATAIAIERKTPAMTVAIMTVGVATMIAETAAPIMTAMVVEAMVGTTMTATA